MTNDDNLIFERYLALEYDARQIRNPNTAYTPQRAAANLNASWSGLTSPDGGAEPIRFHGDEEMSVQDTSNEAIVEFKGGTYVRRFENSQIKWYKTTSDDYVVYPVPGELSEILEAHYQETLISR